ncbi:hypothetical protein TNCV_1974981 [Trichonephila clavipes]|nr:hypothetical protein TNCV_1974981 [Trichonephila clavipes]
MGQYEVWFPLTVKRLSQLEFMLEVSHFLIQMGFPPLVTHTVFKSLLILREGREAGIDFPRTFQVFSMKIKGLVHLYIQRISSFSKISRPDEYPTGQSLLFKKMKSGSVAYTS